MTVEEHMDFTQDQLDKFEELAGDNEYWSGAHGFYEHNKRVDVDHLSPKQFNWLNKIYDDVFDRARAG